MLKIIARYESGMRHEKEPQLYPKSVQNLEFYAIGTVGALGAPCQVLVSLKFSGFPIRKVEKSQTIYSYPETAFQFS